jgi:hypothetical protein
MANAAGERGATGPFGRFPSNQPVPGPNHPAMGGNHQKQTMRRRHGRASMVCGCENPAEGIDVC